MRRVLFAVAFALSASVVGACGGSTSSGSPPPTSPPTTAPAPLRAYVSDAGRGAIYAFSLPLTPTSKAVAVLADNASPGGMAFDPMHRLVVANASNTGSGGVQVYTQPIVSGAAASFTLTSDIVHDVKLDASGNAYVLIIVRDVFGGGADSIGEFSAPLSGPTQESYSFAQRAGLYPEPGGFAFDSSGNVWTNGRFGNSTPQFEKYSPPFGPSNNPVLTIPNSSNGFGLAFDSAGNLYATGPNGIDVYKPPFSASTLKAFTINAKVSTTYPTFDASGNLYVANASGHLLEFAPPFSGASVPKVTLALPGAPPSSGIAIGP
jgi:outer membrane protein assembly factor BamB